MSRQSPVIWWVRRELRVGDNPVLQACIETGKPIIPVFILDEVFENYGAAPLWRFGLGAAEFGKTLNALGSKLIFRRGNALEVLSALIAETGATSVRWGRAYDPDQITRDKKVKFALGAKGIDAASIPAHLLFEPWSVETKTGTFYKVYSPFWRAVKDRTVSSPLGAPSEWLSPSQWPISDDPKAWRMHEGMHRGASVVLPHQLIGEDAAAARLSWFIENAVDTYKERRDLPGVDATSRLSQNLAWGEISPKVLWHSGMRAMAEGKRGAEHFLKEVVWREFAYHLLWHSPHILTDNWRDGWTTFPWKTDQNSAHATAWRRGRTGIPFVDAAMREMYVTGQMHNRARMIVASYLCKHLMTHWKIGMDWFAECLTDWDPASNAMGWQWTAGCGPDAAPYFRVFNPVTQLIKFDSDHVFADRWIAEGKASPSDTSLSYFKAIPKQWGLAATDTYPNPIVSAEDGRKAALAAYGAREI